MSSVVMNYENLKGLLSNEAIEGRNGGQRQAGVSRDMPFNRRQPNIGFVVEAQQPNAERGQRLNNSLYDFIRENDP